MSSWGYAELNSWPQERSSSGLHQREHLEQQQQELLVGNKRLRRDPEQQQQLWSLRVPTSDLDTISESFQGDGCCTGGVRGRDVGSRFYMDETSFLDSDEAVSSSCHFSLSDVGARIGLFNQQAPSQKEMEESWEAINNLGDMDDLFGNNSSFAQPSSLEQSLSSHASPTTPSSSSVMLLGSNQLPPAIGDLRNPSCMHVNSSSPSSASNGKVTSSDSTYRPADISPLLQGTVKSSTMFGFDHQQQHKQQVCRRLESYFQAPMGVPPVPGEALGSQHMEGGGGSYSINQGDQVVAEGEGFVQPWSERREANSTCSSGGGHDEASSLEAAVFYQLASTMSKLDVGTRLCIRNALYRLAKSASFRNRDDNAGLGSKFEPSCRNADIACLETCTNPIDRTVASLLFYKQDQQQQQTQQQQQQTVGNIIAPQETYSSCLSPHSAISSSSCATKPPEIRLHTTLPPPPPLVSRPELPMMMLNTSSVFGNKLPLPPLRYNRHNRRL